MALTQSQQQLVVDTAAAIGVPASWLYSIIQFESAGTWDPMIANKNSSARGLIQFIDSTARGMGYTSSADLVQKHPTVEAQLKGPVRAYFQGLGPFANEQDFYMSVFLPKYRKAAADTVIYADDPARQATFRKANPGIQLVSDYVNRVKKAAAGKLLVIDVPKVKSLLLPVGVAGVLLLLGIKLLIVNRGEPAHGA